MNGIAGKERSIFGRLVAKDLYLYRWLMAGTFAAGAGSLVLSGLSEADNVTTGLNVGIVLFMTTIITFGVLVPMLGILKERQDGSELFVLSLPVSPAQYRMAKIVAALIAFLTPWLALTGGAIAATAISGRPGGGIPGFVAMMVLFLANFCVLMAVIVITMSEVWAVAGILVTNVSVPLFLAWISRQPGVAAHRHDPVATWTPTVLSVLGVEVALIALSLVLAVAVPSRRRDLV